MLMQMTSWHGR